MKHLSKKKLSLGAETLRTLSSDEAANVVGGNITSMTNITQSCLCGSGVCSIAAACNITNTKDK